MCYAVVTCVVRVDVLVAARANCALKAGEHHPCLLEVIVEEATVARLTDETSGERRVGRRVRVVGAVEVVRGRIARVEGEPLTYLSTVCSFVQLFSVTTSGVRICKVYSRGLLRVVGQMEDSLVRAFSGLNTPAKAAGSDKVIFFSNWEY